MSILKNKIGEENYFIQFDDLSVISVSFKLEENKYFTLCADIIKKININKTVDLIYYKIKKDFEEKYKNLVDF